MGIADLRLTPYSPHLIYVRRCVRNRVGRHKDDGDHALTDARPGTPTSAHRGVAARRDQRIERDETRCPNGKAAVQVSATVGRRWSDWGTAGLLAVGGPPPPLRAGRRSGLDVCALNAATTG